MNRFGLSYLPDEHICIDYELDDKYPWKWHAVYEEDGIGKVCYYVLQRDNPRKTIANRIFKDNPQIQKVYMALRDYVSYDLIRDLERNCHIKIYTRQGEDK